MFPEEFIKRLDTQEYIDSDSLIAALGQPAPVSIIVNRNKWDHIPDNSTPVPWCNNGYYLNFRPSYTLDPLFHAGCYYPKEASGMFLAKIFEYYFHNPQNLRVLDLCAAPGGKSLQVSDAIGEGSLLISNEIIRSRASVLNETVTKWGNGNTIVTRNDASDFGDLKGYFDAIVVDAPCSGEGMFRSEDVRKEWSPENTDLCTARQKRLLMDAWPALKENGLLIYSTCTFNHAENEDNISWLSQQADIESLKIDVTSYQGIIEIHKSGIHGYGFYPDRLAGEGFFISVVKKLSSEKPSQLKKRKKAESIPGKDEITTAEKWTKFLPGTFFRKGDHMISCPCSPEEYEYLESHLHIIKGGTSMFTKMKSDFIPSHELAVSRYLGNDSFPSINADYGDALAYLGRGQMKTASSRKGWNIVKYKDVGLGFVKDVGTRINNYYPVEWRIRMEIPSNSAEKIIRWKS